MQLFKLPLMVANFFSRCNITTEQEKKGTKCDDKTYTNIILMEKTKMTNTLSTESSVYGWLLIKPVDEKELIQPYK